MKTISVAILFTCMVAVTFSNLLMIASYKLNRQYISKTLCINKDNAAMHCNGRCYLNKQLSKAEKPSSPLNTKSSERFEIQLFCISVSLFSQNNFKTKKAYFNKRQNFTAQQFSRLNFRPPQV